MATIKKPTFFVQLPYPDPVLSPNSAKRHWRHKQAAKEAQRDYSYYKAIQHAGLFSRKIKLQMVVTFFPPNHNRRDLDNALTSMKSAVDGVCKGLQIDDSQIRRATVEWGTVVENGIVELELKQY